MMYAVSGNARTWIHAHRPHIAGSIFLTGIGVPALWFALAYGGLPRLWSHHEHRRGKVSGDTVAYTAQDIPGDPINLEVIGTQSNIDCRLAEGGWHKADDVSVRSGLQIGASV